MKEYLEERKIFKLICGAGNQDTAEIEKLISVYSSAGCRFFDLSPKKEIIEAAKRGLKHSGAKDCYLCISIGTSDDIHFFKANIDDKKCTKCEKCINHCLQGAITKNGKNIEVNKKRCIGCRNCINNCPNNSIEMQQEEINLNEIIKMANECGISCIELHTTGKNKKELYPTWEKLNKEFNGNLSICIAQNKLGQEKIIKRISKLINKIPPYKAIIQADGIAMSGKEDSYNSTLQAISIAQIFNKANLPAYLIVSGGTNSKTSELAKMCDIKLDGVAIGSYARKIVKEFINAEDFLNDKKSYDNAVNVARNLIEQIEKNL
ncbi:MAG: hypothetical protein E7Z91_05785 [Cyanobacteria bacterium SIG30]|nr:hypothetical protein [Cyanobacteria bacterium SIG30]